MPWWGWVIVIVVATWGTVYLLSMTAGLFIANKFRREFNQELFPAESPRAQRDRLRRHEMHRRNH